MELFKVQTAHGNEAVLIYNKDRSSFAPVHDVGMANTISALLGMEPMSKVYVMAEIDDKGQVSFALDTVLRDPENWPEW